MGEREAGVLRLGFDRRLKLEFHGSKVSSDAGLLPYRELDDAVGLTEIAGDALTDTRRGKNGRHGLVGQFRQSVFGRLGGYDDVNDADRLSLDPVMRWIIGGHAVMKQAASTSQMGRFETEVLATNANVEALTDISGVWIDRVHDRHPPTKIILDMDSSVSPTHGDQEGTAYNGHFGCTCYHPLFLFNQFGDLERCSLRPGSVHSADDWEGVLKPVVVRYKGRKIRLYFRGDAAFASPEMYEYLEAEGFLYAIRLPKNQILQESIAHLLTRPVGRPPNHVRRYYASFSYQAGSWDRKRRVVAKVGSPCRFHRHQPVAPRRAGGGLLQSTRQGGAIHQGRQERDQMDATVVPEVPRQRRPAPASRPGLQSCQLHADACFAKGGRALVAHDAAGKVGEDRCESGQPWPVRHVPIGRGCRPKKLVAENPEPD
jgi:hypothetical protein